MSTTFIGILKLHESANWNLELAEFIREGFYVRLTGIALQYGYGIKYHTHNLYWNEQIGELIDEAITLLGDPKVTEVFEVESYPGNELAHSIFTRELQDPLDWEKIHFPTFLLEIWQQPLVVAALFMRVVAEGGQMLPSIKELPRPTSIYRVMDEIVALRATSNAPTTLYYLDKSSMEPFKRV